MSSVDIGLAGMAIMYALLAVPYGIMRILGVDLLRRTTVSIVRMTVQLALVGLYLKVIFDLNSVWLNGAWVLVMIVAANITVMRNAGMRSRRFFAPGFIGIALSTLSVTAVFVGLALSPEPLYDARYLIPISGMILGNCLRANIISLERFFSGLKAGRREYLACLLLGATKREATKPFRQSALRAALAPLVATMATLGLVSLPGMMTGQILGGSFPLVAIQYQIAIMIAIFTATSISTSLILMLSMRTAFDAFGMVHEGVWAEAAR